MNEMLADSAVLVGPATVRAVEDDHLVVDLPSGEAWARLALGYPYRPAQGDVVLVAGESELYVIGVLAGRGKTVFEAAGDLEIRASGRLRLESGVAMELTSPTVRMRADKVEVAARAIFERAVNCYRWVKETLQTRAGRLRTRVDGHSTLAAERILQSAAKEVKINGRQIHLG
jgi:hypothetical protein